MSVTVDSKPVVGEKCSLNDKDTMQRGRYGRGVKVRSTSGGHSETAPQCNICLCCDATTPLFSVISALRESRYWMYRDCTASSAPPGTDNSDNHQSRSTNQTYGNEANYIAAMDARLKVSAV